MLRILLIILFLSLISHFLNGCNSTAVDKDIFEFKDTYVGDNSSVGNIVNQLPNGELIKEFELKTKDEPYGIILSYEEMKLEDKEKETVVYNSTFLFALVQNLDWISFNFNSQDYKITKEALQDWYGEELQNYTSEDELKELIELNIRNESKVNKLFN